MTQPTLTDMEWEVLEECAGMREPREWGAAVGQALEVLHGNGLIDRGGFLAHAGRKALADRVRKVPGDLAEGG